MNQDELEIYDKIINELESKGINYTDNYETVGVGDIVESVLNKFGITQDRFKKFFSIEECNCTKRKKWLNGLFSWRMLKH
jgi:hypothetical protein